MKSQIFRITYRTSENSHGQSRLWLAVRTKTDFKEALNRHHIDPNNVFRFEVKKENGYEERSLAKFLEIVG
jgi:hypothetical protein